MNRRIRRAVDRHNDELEKLIMEKTTKALKDQKIDYTIQNGEILTSRKKDVQFIYDDVRLTVFSAFSKAQGNMDIFRKLFARMTE
jgi:hypothetical protein